MQETSQLREAQLVMLNILDAIHDICQKHKIEYWLDWGTQLGAIRHKGFIPWDDDIDIAMTRENYNRFMQIAPSELSSDFYLQTEKTDEGYYDIITAMKVRDTNSQMLEWFETGEESYHLGLFVDIFPYDNIPQNSFMRFLKKDFARNILKIKHVHLKKRGKLKYRTLAKIFSLNFLNALQEKLIKSAQKNETKLFGYGYDCAFKKVYNREEFFPLQEAEFEGKKFFVPKNYDYYLTKTYGDYMQFPPKEDQVPKHMKNLKIFKKDKD